MSEDVVVETLNEADVAKFLTENPTFFLKQEQLLADMFLPHASGEAVSLLERQVSILRERNIEARKRLSDILEQGQRNDVLFQKTRGLILALLETKNINDLARCLIEYCEQEFQVDAVSFTLIANADTHKATACQVLAENEIKLVMSSLLSSKEAMSGVFREEELKLMFADKSASLQSAAIMPVRANNTTLAFISLGSQDAHYFQTGIDTLFLGFIADVLARLLPKYC